MANASTSKFWLLDTVGIVVETPVFIKNVFVTWKVSSAGAIDLTEFSREDGVGVSFCFAKTLGATSAAVDQLTQVFPINEWVTGLNLKTITNVDALIVQIA